MNLKEKILYRERMKIFNFLLKNLRRILNKE